MAVDLTVTDETLTVTLADGRVLSVPLAWYPRLAQATTAERAHWHLLGGGYAIEWPDLDEHIGVAGLLAGRRSGESEASLKQWMASRKIDDQNFRTSSWTTLCQRAQSQGRQMARSCSNKKFAALVDQETSTLCDYEPPTSDAEYNLLFSQSQALTAKISAITDADQMAGNHPHVADRIFDRTQRFCQHVPLAGNVSEASQKLTSEISALCR